MTRQSKKVIDPRWPDYDFNEKNRNRLKGMRSRCYNPRDICYKNYGGRGIKICDRWMGKDGYKNFLADMDYPPTPWHSIDRIDNDGTYEPSNCQWATVEQQRSNRRTIRKNETKWD